VDRMYVKQLGQSMTDSLCRARPKVPARHPVAGTSAIDCRKDKSWGWDAVPRQLMVFIRNIRSSVRVSFS
jgi:hypothetical protein